MTRMGGRRTGAGVTAANSRVRRNGGVARPSEWSGGGQRGMERVTIRVKVRVVGGVEGILEVTR